MWRCIAVAFLIGCGRLQFDPIDTVDAEVTPDAGFASGSFGAPSPLVELNSPSAEDDASMTGDLLELYFSSNRSGADYLYAATRSAPDQPWSAPALVAELNADGTVNNPKVTSDGLAIYFSASRSPNAGGPDLWFSTRIDRASPWQSPQRIEELATADDEYEPSVDRAQLTMYFSSTATTARPDPWRASRASASEPWGTPAPVAELASTQNDSSTWVDDTGLHAAFHSDRSGTRMLYEAMRASTSEPFGSIAPIAGVDTAALEQDVWMSPDGRVLLFASDAAGTIDLYIATR